MIEDSLFTRLSGFGGLTALVASRIYPNLAPQNAAYPHVTFRRVTSDRPSAMNRDSGVVRARFQFDTFNEAYDGARLVRDQLRAALQRWRDPGGTPVVQDVFLISETDLYEDDSRIHHLADDFEVIYRE